MAFDRESGLKGHYYKYKTKCPECHATFSKKENMFRHYRKKHPYLLNDDGSSKTHGDLIIAKPTPRVYIPAPFESLVGTELWQKLKQEGYPFIVEMVKRNLHNDIQTQHKTIKFTDKESAYCRDLLRDNVLCHKLAQDILDYLIENEMLRPGAHDEAGGVLPKGFILRRHGGLFALGLDRRDNEHPHFIPGCPVVGPGSNLRVVAKAINTRANTVVTYGTETCVRLREVMMRPVTDLEKEATWLREQKATGKKNGKKVNNAAYDSCNHVFRRDKECQAAFPGGVNTFFHHCLILWAEQGLCCAVSGVLLQGNDCDHSFYKMSLDAIKPIDGHVPGNLRWVCQGLNSTNCDKVKRVHDENDPPSAWTCESLASYLGMELIEVTSTCPFTPM